MEIQSQIVFQMSPDEANKQFSMLGVKINNKDTMQVFEVSTENIAYQKIIDILKELRVDFSEDKRKVYSNSDLKSSSLLQVIPTAYCGYPQPEDDDGYWAVSYDISSGCSNCLNGKIQTKPIRLSKPKIGNKDILGIHWILEIVVTSKLRHIIEEKGFTGCEFWPLIDHKKEIPFDDIFQLYISNILPPMNSSAKLTKAPLIEECDCGKRGLMLEEEPIYDKSTLSSVKDFNKTHEWLGGGYGAWQFPIISKRVFDCFQEMKIRGVRFEPVILI